jgi:hypothetical protein
VKRRTKIAAVDFDDTLCKRGGKTDGEPVEGSRKGMEWLRENGYFIVIWTCSNKSDEEILDWLAHHGYPEVDGINKELTQWKTHSPKIVATVYIDDRAAGWSGWSKAIKWLKEQNTPFSMTA